jgi:fructose-1,6-bisphosphatase/inositol monophosphatase family enzyme
MLNAVEKACIDAYRSGARSQLGGSDIDAWIGFGITLLLDAGRLIRGIRLSSDPYSVEYKGDGSPATQQEEEIESLLRERLAEFEPGTTVVGEETGGQLPASGLAVAVDPVDGTWSFLNRTETHVTTLAVFRDGEPFLGMVSNPNTGEIGYAPAGAGARLLQLSLFGEPDAACSLPMARATPGSLLVNVHPQRGAGPLVGALYDAWRQSGLRMVRSPGGAPAWALLEAAKGSFVYVNLWSKRAAEPYDLAAGVLLVRRAGGEVTDLEGSPIDMVRHRGPLVAAVDDEARERIAAITRQVVEGA